MKFSQKFLIFIFSVLIFTIGINILALKYFTTQYFDEYLTVIKHDVPDINFDLIAAFTNTKNLDDATIEEYKKVLNDLSGISSSLEKFSSNPRAYAPSIIDSLQKIGVSGNSIEQVLFINALDSFFSNIFSLSVFDNTTPEGRFVFRVITAMIIVNVSLIVFILLISYLWIHRSFRPIQTILENLSNIISRKGYKQIEYSKKDEFGALISAINSLNESLSRQQQIRSDFLSDLSHEIKTPITAIKCYLEGMDDGMIETSEANYRLLHREIDRLINITSSIMEYERLEQEGTDSLTIEPIDFIELVKSIRDEYIPMLQKNHQKIVCAENKNFLINLDSERTIQMIHNIFSNFLKYAWLNTTLSIKLSRKNNWINITFADNGKWIATEEILFVREKFYQVEKSRTRSADGGLGIGLSIIDKIVTMHNGICTIESDSGKGFIIRIKIPV